MRAKSTTTLGLNAFEERVTPATFTSYSAGTLTLTAATGDAITVSRDANNISGQLTVSDGTNLVFQSAGRPVLNVVVRSGTAASYSLSFGADVSLNNLTAYGASTNTTVTLAATTRITKNFSYIGHPTALGTDTVAMTTGSRVGGNVSINGKAGANTVNLAGGSVGGNVYIYGWNNADTVNLAGAGDLFIGGTLSLSLGHGANTLNGAGANSLTVGRNLLYGGGNDDDRIDFYTNGTALLVGGTVSMAFGNASVEKNDWISGSMFVGGDFFVSGGGGFDEVGLYGPGDIGGNFIANMGSWTNQLFVGYDGTAQTSVGGVFRYTGGTGYDAVYLDNALIGGLTTLSLGQGGGFSQLVQLGTRQAAGVAIDGGLSISTGNEADDVRIYLATVGAGTTINTGAGNDDVFLNDSEFQGSVSVNLGTGDDVLGIETGSTNGNGTDLTGIVQIAENLTVQASDGLDQVDMRSQVGEMIVVGGQVRLFGGLGEDTLFTATTGDIYLKVPVEDFEIGSFPV